MEVDLLINLYCRPLHKGAPWYMATGILTQIIATINQGMAILFLLIMQGLIQYLQINLARILGYLWLGAVYLVITMGTPSKHKAPYILKRKCYTSDWLHVRFRALVDCCMETISAPNLNMKSKRRQGVSTSHQHNQH